MPIKYMVVCMHSDTATCLFRYSRTPILRFHSTGAHLSSNTVRSATQQALLERHLHHTTTILSLHGYLFFGSAPQVMSMPMSMPMTMCMPMPIPTLLVRVRAAALSGDLRHPECPRAQSRLTRRGLTRCGLTRCGLAHCGLACCGITRCGITHCGLACCGITR